MTQVTIIKLLHSVLRGSFPPPQPANRPPLPPVTAVMFVLALAAATNVVHNFLRPSGGHHLISPQIPRWRWRRRRQTCSAVIDGRRRAAATRKGEERERRREKRPLDTETRLGLAPMGGRRRRRSRTTMERIDWIFLPSFPGIMEGRTGGWMRRRGRAATGTPGGRISGSARKRNWQLAAYPRGATANSKREAGFRH